MRPLLVLTGDLTGTGILVFGGNFAVVDVVSLAQAVVVVEW